MTKNKKVGIFTIENHNYYDKWFEFYNEHISMRVDNDDVNEAEVASTTELMKLILDKYWDEDLFRTKYKENLMRIWNDNEHQVQWDYETGCNDGEYENMTPLEAYLSSNGCNYK